jgi:holin-like protein
MLAAITLLLVFQLVGEVLARALGLPVPGPVIGLALLFATLALRRHVAADLRDTANGLLSHLSLLFVPAGTGVLVHLDRLGGELAPIGIALVASTVLTIAATALTMRWLMRFVRDETRE